MAKRLQNSEAGDCGGGCKNSSFREESAPSGGYPGRSRRGSETYVAAKVKACEVVGFGSTLIRFEDTVTQEELLQSIKGLNEDPSIDGFIVQLPLPKHISEER